MTDAELYAINRMEDLIRAVAGCLTSDTLQQVLDDIEDYRSTPIPEDLARFASRMSEQLATLTD